MFKDEVLDFYLESGYGKSELAQNANNCFGMKKYLSGNTWSGSVWDGASIYTKQTKEQNIDGTFETITADFRKYGSIEDSFADHLAYLIGAKNGEKLRYDGIVDMTDYREVAKLIKDGGYATSLTYVEKLCEIIERWDLTQFDIDKETGYPVKLVDGYYRVRKAWSDETSQIGAYKVLDNAKKKADENREYFVFDNDGNEVYPRKKFEPHLVKVEIDDLNIRKEPGTDYERTGKYTGRGVFTIVEEADGKGATKWGRLKSGAGWISLDFAKRV